MSIRVLVVEDQRVVRSAFCALVRNMEGMEVVGDADNGRQAVELAETLRAQVVLMDVTMPEMNGIQATQKITRQPGSARVIGLSGHSDGGFVAQMLEAGASGYLPKNCDPQELETAIRRVAAGRRYVSADLLGSTLNARPAEGDPKSNGNGTTLGDREREVLQLVAEGCTSKQIALRLKISRKTVDVHRQNLMQKLDLYSVAELTKYAVRHGLTPLEK